jgi:membrane-bound serine protease (ClpP class)
LTWIAAWIALLFLAAAPLKAETEDRLALMLSLDGAVTPASADYLIRGMAEAAERGAELVILRIDTPGGLVTSTREIISAILGSPVPVAAWVAPSGARAASAGTYIMYASHIAAMAPSTHIGAATPVALGGGSLPFGERDDEDGGAPAQRSTSAAELKSLNDAVAYLQGLAELRGRNSEWAEKAVREAATLTAPRAVAENVVDFTARTAEEVLAAADGRVVEVGGTARTLATADLTIVPLDPDWRTRLLSVITNPNVALLLMVLGFYGILFELFNPGALVPGTIGAISLLTGLYALSVLPVSYAGLALILLGLALIVAEAFAPSFGILGIGGAAALMLGSVLLFDGDVPGLEVHWPVIAAVVVASAGLALLVARLAAMSYRREVRTGRDEMLGAMGRVQDWQGGRGHVFVHGERWNARGPDRLPAGTTVRITGLDGLTLVVTPIDDGRA